MSTQVTQPADNRIEILEQQVAALNEQVGLQGRGLQEIRLALSFRMAPPSDEFRGIVKFVLENLESLAAGVVRKKKHVIQRGGGKQRIGTDIAYKISVLRGDEPNTFDFGLLSEDEKRRLRDWGFDLDRVRGAAEADSAGVDRFNEITDALSDALNAAPPH